MKKIPLTVTIEEGLRSLDSSLIIPISQNATISTRQGEIEKIVVNKFDALGTALAGACTRNTMIQPLADNVIDLFVLLKLERGQLNTPGELMGKLEDILLAHYPDAVVAENGLAIIVPNIDFVFHITPGFTRDDKGYVVVDAKNNKWIKTDPNVHYYALDDDNRKHKGLLLPVIRIIKYWNECNGSLFDNYYLELLVKEILSDAKVNSYVHAIKYFFKKAIRLVLFTINDPAAAGAQMDGLKDIHKMLEAMFCCRDCHDHIIKAESYERAGDLKSAYKEFGKIFGGYFLSYVDMMSKKLDANGITGAEALIIMRDST